MSTVIFTGSSTLRELSVRHDHFGNNGISMITESLQSNKTLTKLKVSYCHFTEEGVYRMVYDE